MKMDNLFSLIKELATVNTLHKEYRDKDIQFVIDSKRDGNTLHFSVQIKEDKDKKEFEKWASQLDDDFFSEVWEALAEETNLLTLNEEYESGDYKKVIAKFKAKAKEIATEKISMLNKILA